MKRILIFEQDPKEAVRLSQFLQNSGYAVATVTTGRQAASFIREYDFELYLVNSSAPGENGFATVLELKQQVRMRSVRVLAMVGNPSLCPIAEEAGADGTLVHPVDDDLLLRSVAALLEHAGGSIRYLDDPKEAPVLAHSSAPDEAITFKSVTESLVGDIDGLVPFLPELGEQGPLALESMEDAVVNLCRRLDLETVASGQEVPESVYDRKQRHDFRNLLAAINGFAEILLLEEGLSEALTKRLQRIKKASRQFCQLLDNIKESAA